MPMYIFLKIVLNFCTSVGVRKKLSSVHTLLMPYIIEQDEDLNQPSFFEEKSLGKDFSEDEMFRRLESCKLIEDRNYKRRICIYINDFKEEYDFLEVEMGICKEKMEFRRYNSLFLGCPEDQEEYVIKFTFIHGNRRILEKFTVKKLDTFIGEFYAKGGNVEITVILCLGLNHEFDVDLEETSIIGHRGDGSADMYKIREKIKSDPHLPIFYENTISSFKSAKDKGANWVELDVQLTQEKIPVVFHDFIIKEEETSRSIFNLSYNNFLDAFGYSWNEENNPCSLERLFDELGNEIGYNLELKYPSKFEMNNFKMQDIVSLDIYVERIIKLVVEKGIKKVIFSSFNPLIVFYIRMRIPLVNCFLIIDTTDNATNFSSLYLALEISKKCMNKGVVINFEAFLKDPQRTADIFKKFGIEKIYVYGSEVSIVDNVKQLRKYGIFGAITDDLSSILSIKD